MSEAMLKKLYKETASSLYGKELGELNPYELNNVIANVVKNEVIK